MVKRPSVSTSAESAHLFIEKSSEPAQAESVVTSDSNIEHLSLRQSPATASTGKLPLTVKSMNKKNKLYRQSNKTSIPQIGMITKTHSINALRQRHCSVPLAELERHMKQHENG